MRSSAGQRFAVGQRVERNVYFAGRATEFVAPHAFQEIRGQLRRLKKFFESEMRVNAGGYYVGGNLFSRLQNNPGRASFFHQNFSYRSFGANFDASFACRCGNSVGNGAGSSAAESPGANRSVNLTHVVM